MTRPKLFLALEVFINGERQCIAGDPKQAVLSTALSWARRPPPANETFDFDFHVGGLTTAAARSRDRTFTSWIDRHDLRPGDEVRIRIVKVKRAEPPKKRTVRTIPSEEESRRRTYLRLKAEFEPENPPRPRKRRAPSR